MDFHDIGLYRDDLIMTIPFKKGNNIETSKRTISKYLRKYNLNMTDWEHGL